MISKERAKYLARKLGGRYIPDDGDDEEFDMESINNSLEKNNLSEKEIRNQDLYKYKNTFTAYYITEDIDRRDDYAPVYDKDKYDKEMREIKELEQRNESISPRSSREVWDSYKE